MKDLILIRHAKSSWENILNDYDRPLSSRGINDAYNCSNYLKNKIEKPELILCSFAVRTYSTAMIFLNNMDLGFDNFFIKRELYDFQGDSVLNTIASIDDNINSTIIFCHNNAITNITNQLGNIRIDNVPTCGIVGFNLNLDNWANIFSISNQNIFLNVTPKKLREN